MTNKIIIDGVDVSECDHYTDGECYFNYFDGISEGRCTDFKNCDHKQLQRKTAECEKLKEEKQDYCFNCDVAERMRKVVHAATGGRLSYANYTVDAIEQAYHDQLEIDVEYRTKILKEENAKLKAECEELKKKLMQKSEVDMFFNTPVNGWSNNPCDICECKQALDEIEGIVNKKTEILICDECAYRNIPECKENCMQDVLGEILDIISKAKGEGNNEG